jgi:hypothetical protein
VAFWQEIRRKIPKKPEYFPALPVFARVWNHPAAGCV